MIESIEKKEADTIERLTYNSKEIILIGTAHVSKKSVELVKEMIDLEQPDTVCVELDEARYQNMLNPKSWEETDISKIIKEKKTGYLLVNIALSSYQKKMAKNFDSQVGGEIIQAIESAKGIGAKLELIDRDIQLTFKRIWGNLSFMNKVSLPIDLIFAFDEDTEMSEEELDDMLDKDMMETAMADLNKEFPTIGKILVSERDDYLATKIMSISGNKIIAVLGNGHMAGVIDRINSGKKADLVDLTTIPTKKSYLKVIGWSVPLIIVGLILFSFYQNFESGKQQLSAWILWNSGLAGLFTLLSLGHPLTVLTSIVTAPIATLNPFLGVGWFAGLAEASLRKPTVKDLQNVQTDIFSIKGFFKNRLLKTILIVITASLGGALGNIIGGMDMIRNLFG